MLSIDVEHVFSHPDSALSSGRSDCSLPEELPSSGADLWRTSNSVILPDVPKIRGSVTDWRKQKDTLLPINTNITVGLWVCLFYDKWPGAGGLRAQHWYFSICEVFPKVLFDVDLHRLNLILNFRKQICMERLYSCMQILDFHLRRYNNLPCQVDIPKKN